MDRPIVYVDENILDTDFLSSQRNIMVALGIALQAILGTSTVVDGLTCTPTSPASLQVLISQGSIYSFVNVDGTAYGSLNADTAHQIVKQGINLGTLTLPAVGSITPPSTTGYSQNYLVQVTYQDVDTGSTVLPYYNAANPSVAYEGPSNAGTSQNTVRQGACTISLKAGTAATTGSQTTPAPDAGYTGLWVIAVANGATTITSGNISKYSGAPFINYKLPQLSPAGAGRTLLSGNTTFYVSTGGSDSNAGTSGSPWATITHALSVLTTQYDLGGYTATIQLQDTGSTTTYTTPVTGMPSVTGPIIIQGNPSYPTRVVVSTTSNSAFNFSGQTPYPITLQYLQIQTTTSGWGVLTTFGGVSLTNITFGPCAQGCWSASGAGGYVQSIGPVTIAGSTSVVSQTYQQGQFNALGAVFTISGTPAWGTAFAQAQGVSEQYWGGATFSGSATGKYFNVVDNAAIETGSSANPTFFPGSVTGTYSNGGNYS